MGVITAYDFKQDLYNIQYTNRQQERVSHEDVLLIYCPPTKRVDKDILLKEIEAAQDSNLDKRSPVEKLEDLAGRTFLMDIEEDGTRDRAKIIIIVDDAAHIGLLKQGLDGTRAIVLNMERGVPCEHVRLLQINFVTPHSTHTLFASQ